MCHRVTPLFLGELEEALRELHLSGHARIPARDPQQVVPDAYPGKQLPLFVPNDASDLQATELVWGFDKPGGKGGLVFNTRLDTALAQAHSGRGLWATPITRGRCLVPVRGFYENWTRSNDRSRQVRFTLPGSQVFLLAGVQHEDRVSIVTTEPNADVGLFHQRMPLVLAPGESSVWLGPDFARLADRSHIHLSATPEEDARGATLPGLG